jgi:hypothetical protein
MHRGPERAESRAHLEVQQTTERNPEMGRNRSFERRAREEVERIKSEEAAEEERKQARMRELALQAREQREAEAAEQRRRKEERDAKLRRSEDEKAEGQERQAKDLARRSWKASGGGEAAFDEAWPSIWEEMLKRRTVDADMHARQEMAHSGVAAFRDRSQGLPFLLAPPPARNAFDGPGMSRLSGSTGERRR